jgi:hypothetical protein
MSVEDKITLHFIKPSWSKALMKSLVTGSLICLMVMDANAVQLNDRYDFNGYTQGRPEYAWIPPSTPAPLFKVENPNSTFELAMNKGAPQQNTSSIIMSWTCRPATKAQSQDAIICDKAKRAFEYAIKRIEKVFLFKSPIKWVKKDV